MKSLIDKYLSDKRGHFAVQFAVLGLPLVIMTTFVPDYMSANVEKVNVKTALDAAVIAAVNNNSLTISEKEDYARNHFNQNYQGDVKFTLDPKATDARVEMSAKGLAPVSVAAALGIKGIDLYEKSAAEIASENVICVMALNESAASSITFEESNGFLADTCSVHSNSSAANAIVSTSSKTPIAKSFCAVGGLEGKFEPYGKGDCKPIEDPYKYVKPAPSGPCMPETSIDYDTWNEMRVYSSQMQSLEIVADGGNVNGNGNGKIKPLNAGDEAMLKPGTYCGGLIITGKNVKFMSGDYVLQDGAFTFMSGSSATGENVTFTMSGSLLDIKAGSDVRLKAPRFGDRAGLVFMEDTQYIPGKNGNKKQIHNIKGGASLNVLGTLYFPTQSLVVKGDKSALGAQSPATSFIANDIHFSGIGSSVSVKVNHVAAGLPPIMPRVEDGARLIE